MCASSGCPCSSSSFGTCNCSMTSPVHDNERVTAVGLGSDASIEPPAKRVSGAVTFRTQPAFIWVGNA